MKIELQVYSNNIALSYLNGTKVLSKKTIEVPKRVKSQNTYNLNGKIKQNTVGLLFDRCV